MVVWVWRRGGEVEYFTWIEVVGLTYLSYTVLGVVEQFRIGRLVSDLE